MGPVHLSVWFEIIDRTSRRLSPGRFSITSAQFGLVHAFSVHSTRRGSISLDIAGRRWRWRKQRRWPAAFITRRVARCNIVFARLYYTQGWRILIESHDRSIKERHNVTFVSANEDRPRNHTRRHKCTMGFLWLKTIVNCPRETARGIIRYRGQVDCQVALPLALFGYN